jgi:hypothetical protein
MFFSASAVTYGPTVNGLLLVVEAFTVFFDHFFLILFLQREGNCKCDNTNNSEKCNKSMSITNQSSFYHRSAQLVGI